MNTSKFFIYIIFALSIFTFGCSNTKMHLVETYHGDGVDNSHFNIYVNDSSKIFFVYLELAPYNHKTKDGLEYIDTKIVDPKGNTAQDTKYIAGRFFRILTINNTVGNYSITLNRPARMSYNYFYTIQLYQSN